MLLMDGRAFPAGEIAARIHVTAPTASHHLKVLVQLGFVEVLVQGRHRYHRLAGPEIANALEVIGLLEKPAPFADSPLRPARCCYNHMAGILGVGLRRTLVEKGWVRAEAHSYRLEEVGVRELMALGFREPSCRELEGKTCLDWTERVDHIAGPLGRLLLSESLRLGWVKRSEVPRALIVQPHRWPDALRLGT